MRKQPYEKVFEFDLLNKSKGISRPQWSSTCFVLGELGGGQEMLAITAVSSYAV